jgi:hypothetical protein
MTDEQREQTPRAPDRSPARDARTGGSAAEARIAHQTHWVEQQLRVAFERGDFDDLPGYGKPIEDLGTEHDPDWWVKKLIEREQVTGVLPPALALRREDAELDARLDGLNVETEVRGELEDFNARVVDVRRQLQGGPPVITPTRDVEAEVAAWRERRAARKEAQRAALAQQQAEQPPRRRWWRRRH